MNKPEPKVRYYRWRSKDFTARKKQLFIEELAFQWELRMCNLVGPGCRDWFYHDWQLDYVNGRAPLAAYSTNMEVAKEMKRALQEGFYWNLVSVPNETPSRI